MGVYRLQVQAGSMPSSPTVINATGSRKPPPAQNPLVWLTLGAVVGALVVAAGSSAFSLQGARALEQPARILWPIDTARGIRNRQGCPLPANRRQAVALRWVPAR